MSSSQLKVCAAVSGNGTVLRAILQAVEDGLLDLRFTGFISDRRCGALDVAAKFGIPATCLNFSDYKSREAFSDDFDNRVLGQSPDLILLHYNRLISSKLLTKFSGPIINTHYSLLPAFIGFNAVPRALASGVHFSGATLHQITERIDDGPVLAQAICPILKTDTVETLGRRLFQASVPVTLALLANAPNFECEDKRTIITLPDDTQAMLSIGVNEDFIAFSGRFVRMITDEK
jgi:phosphoribosylglycinamide formyltransferase-1